MTWEETIQYIRNRPEYEYLVEKAYFDENLKLNVERYLASDEFEETLKIIQSYYPEAKSILDIGCGNGISSVSFSLKGYTVLAVEPDPSETVGAGAIRQLKDKYNLGNLEIQETFAENLNLQSGSFDVVYVRQAMHHAYDLHKFIQEISRVLKPGGLLLTVRDHVVFNDQDKEWFLDAHPLHKFYGGENAYKPSEYRTAMLSASLKIQKEIKYFENVINYFPQTSEDISTQIQNVKKIRLSSFKRKLGFLSKVPLMFGLYNLYLNLKVGKPLDERKVPGRMYSYIAIKQ